MTHIQSDFIVFLAPPSFNLCTFLSFIVSKTFGIFKSISLITPLSFLKGLASLNSRGTNYSPRMNSSASSNWIGPTSGLYRNYIFAFTIYDYCKIISLGTVSDSTK